MQLGVSFMIWHRGKNEIKSSPFEAVPRFVGAVAGLAVSEWGIWCLESALQGDVMAESHGERFGAQCLPCSTAESVPAVETTGIGAFLHC